MKIVVSSASGIEAVTKRELNRLGVFDAPSINGRIAFEGDSELLYKCNLFLSTASKVYVELGSFHCASFDDLYDNLKEIDFENYISEDGRVVVEAKLVSSAPHAVSATQSVAKKAIADRLLTAYRAKTLTESGERYIVEISITKDHCSVCLNTSGEGLHRRGYRTLVGEAQLKETLASALIELSVWNPERPFADIFCGTGTIAIEAALKAKNIPCGMYRDFDFFHHKNADKKLFDEIKSAAISRISPKTPNKIIAGDIDENQLKLLKKHAKSAGVGDDIEIKLADMKDFKSELTRGVVISNPPYGERLSDRRGIERLYRELGKVAANNPDWCFYTLTPVDDFERLFGVRAGKKRKLYNGRIECFYYAHLSKPTQNV